jgi:hypothetical protein
VNTSFNRYVRVSGGGERKAARKTHLGFHPLVGDAVGPLRLRWPWGLGGVVDHRLSPAESFCFMLCCFQCLLRDVSRRLHLKVGIRSSPPYSLSGDASCISGGRVESCARLISCDPIGFCVPSLGDRMFILLLTIINRLMAFSQK